ncbi:NmrA/HSCARG family protein [Aspergillus mulundensis]|uniref:NmrA-like domain-containing protein n=1 Tax=Aspergillus mulundensis TaxID=1810919 RepID=A0A3D8T6F6_9EURO|nr:Uncharacterized protein DSM5745_00920 [Aspergillus mulundensis]RDW93598.1 Uncharacterized protein DSM5745_00920 [Aspergillus mulundensis]
MSTKPALVVLGATGNQGGSVLSYFLSLPSSPYALRGVTRDPSSPKATALASRGVEMVTGNFDDPSSLAAAFKGASAIFSVTDFWPPFFNPSAREKAAASNKSIGEYCRDLEVQQNRNIIDAAAKVDTLERFIFSSLPNPNKLSDGKYKHVYHFEGKAIAEEYGRTAHPALWAKTTVFYAGLYLENWFGPTGALLRPKLNKETDTLVLTLGDILATAPFPVYSAVDDTGALVHVLLRAEPGKKVTGVNKWLSFRDVATTLGEVLGKKVEFVNQDPSFDMGDPEAEKENMDMLGFCLEFRYDGSRIDKSVLQPKDLGVVLQLQSVKAWCAKQDWSAL